MHVGSDDHPGPPPATLTVDDDHVVGVRVEPRVDGLTDAADPLQRGRQVVRPAEVQNLGAGKEIIIIYCRKLPKMLMFMQGQNLSTAGFGGLE